MEPYTALEWSLMDEMWEEIEISVHFEQELYDLLREG